MGVTVGGNAAKSIGSTYTHTFLGITPNVNLVNLRVLDQNGAGTAVHLVEKVSRFMDAHPVGQATRLVGELYETANVRAKSHARNHGSIRGRYGHHDEG